MAGQMSSLRKVIIHGVFLECLYLANVKMDHNALVDRWLRETPKQEPFHGQTLEEESADYQESFASKL